MNQANVFIDHDYRHEADVDESDVNFIAILEQQADLDGQSLFLMAKTTLAYVVI